MALLSASMFSFAANQYCDALSDNENFTFSLKNVTSNVYRVQLDAIGEDQFDGVVNINAGVNQSAGAGIFLGGENAANWVVTPTQAYIDFETETEESVPTSFYVNYFAFSKVGGGVIEINITTSDIDWQTTCGAPEKADPALSLNETEITLNADSDDTFQIEPDFKGDGTVSYESSNPGFASVTDDGLVTALGRGLATITVKVSETDAYAPDMKKLIVHVIGAINWDAVPWLVGSNDKFKVIVSPEIPDQFGGMHAEPGIIWIGFPSPEFSDCTIEYSAVGAGVSFAMSNFPKEFNDFSITSGGETYAITVYNADGSTTSVIDQMANGQSAFVKTIEDGQLIIIKEGMRYNAAGQQIK